MLGTFAEWAASMGAGVVNRIEIAFDVEYDDLLTIYFHNDALARGDIIDAGYSSKPGHLKPPVIHKNG
jgi:hypothetical protein